jgi:CRP-like cAMP-binding protein
MTNDIVQVTTESQVQNAISYMLEGKNKKDACAEAKISTKTFDRFLAASPEFVLQVQQSIRSQFADQIDQISETRQKNLASILEFSETLREEMLAAEDSEDRIKAFQALLKLEVQLQKTMEQILPVIKETGPSGPPKIEDGDALRILGELGKGAERVMITHTTTVELNQTGSDSTAGDVIEGSISPLS